MRHIPSKKLLRIKDKEKNLSLPDKSLRYNNSLRFLLIKVSKITSSRTQSPYGNKV